MTMPPINPPGDQPGGIPTPPMPPQQPPMPPQMPPMPPGQSVQKNDTAMFAMIAGILGVTVCALFAGIPAIILGMSGKKKAKEMVVKVKAKQKLVSSSDGFQWFCLLLQ